MDDDKQVTQSLQDHFLDKLDVRSISEKRDYDIGHEFHKSRKNRSWWVALLVFGIILALAALSVGVTLYIQSNSTMRELNLDQFKDLEFLDVLNQVEALNAKIEVEQRALLSLQQTYDTLRREEGDRYEQNVLLLGEKGLNDDAYGQQLRLLTEEHEQNLAALDDEYVPLIEGKQNEVDELYRQLANYDREKVEQAQAYESVLAAEQQRFNIEKENLIESYETRLATLQEQHNASRQELLDFQEALQEATSQTREGQLGEQYDLYNPVSEDEILQTLLSIPIGELPTISSKIQSLPQDSPYLSSEVVAQLLWYFDQWSLIMSFLQEIPYENDSDRAINQIEARSYIMLEQTIIQLNELLNLLILRDATVSSLNQNLADLQSESSGYRQRIEELLVTLDNIQESVSGYADFQSRMSFTMAQALQNLGGQGIILESPSLDELVAFVNPYLEVPDGAEALIYTRDNRYAASVKLYKEDFYYSLEFLERVEGVDISALDLVIVNQETTQIVGANEE